MSIYSIFITVFKRLAGPPKRLPGRMIDQAARLVLRWLYRHDTAIRFEDLYYEMRGTFYHGLRRIRTNLRAAPSIRYRYLRLRRSLISGNLHGNTLAASWWQTSNGQNAPDGDGTTDDGPKLKVLLLEHKWKAGNPALGPDLDVTGTIKTLEESGLVEQRIFYVDEYFHQQGRSPDLAILEQCMVAKPDCVIINADSSPQINPKPVTQKLIREMGIPMASIQVDTVQAFAMPGLLYRLSNAPEFNAPFVDLYLSQDTAYAHLKKARKLDKYLCLPGPKDGRVFFNGKIDRDIGIGFVGNIRNIPWRVEAIDFLIKAGIDIYTYDSLLHGPNPAVERFLSQADYAQILQRSRIVLNFPFAPWCGKPVFQRKGRPMEVAMCGAMLLEHESPEPSTWLEPFIDYVPYASLPDLVDKARYYLAHDSERAAIAYNGHQKAMTQYNSKIYWTTVFERLGLLGDGRTEQAG